MQSHLILGLLRDGRPRHGYSLASEYRRRSGLKLSTGNFYRELARLAASGLVAAGVNPPEVDARRIPYQITDKGKHEFDDWLLRPSTANEEFEAWLLFADRIAPEVREGLLDRKQEDLWLRGKALARARDDALAERRRNPGGRQAYEALSVLLARRIKQVAAELEFLKELRLESPSGSTTRLGPPGKRGTTDGSGHEPSQRGGGVRSK